MLIGRYSDFKLAEVKQRAVSLRQMLATGQDPIEERVKQRN